MLQSSVMSVQKKTDEKQIAEENDGVEDDGEDEDKAELLLEAFEPPQLTVEDQLRNAQRILRDLGFTIMHQCNNKKK